jgi:hypothetical protein
MLKVNIPQINFDEQKIPVCLSEYDQKDLRLIVNAAIRGYAPRISYQKLINLKSKLAKR